MTPQEKAFELAHKYRLLEIKLSETKFMMISMEDAKQCALIAVDEIIEQNNIWIKQIGKGTNNYLQQVKIEIEKL